MAFASLSRKPALVRSEAMQGDHLGKFAGLPSGEPPANLCARLPPVPARRGHTGTGGKGRASTRLGFTRDALRRGSLDLLARSAAARHRYAPEPVAAPAFFSHSAVLSRNVRVRRASEAAQRQGSSCVQAPRMARGRRAASGRRQDRPLDVCT